LTESIVDALAGKLITASAYSKEAFPAVKEAMGNVRFNKVVKYIADKKDKTEAGKLIAASARSKEAFQAVKEAMGDSFYAVVKYIADKKDKTDAGKLIAASSAHTKEAFPAVKEAMGNVRFNAVVQSLADKEDKTDAGKLSAASARSKEALQAVKEAMGDVSFNGVVTSLVTNKSPQALSIIKAMVHKKSNFDNIVQIIGGAYFKSLDGKAVESIFTSIKSYVVFAAVVEAVGYTNYKAAFENNTKLRKKHNKNIETLKTSRKRKGNNTSQRNKKKQKTDNDSSLPSLPAYTESPDEDLMEGTSISSSVLDKLDGSAWSKGADDENSTDSRKSATVANGGEDNIIANMEIVLRTHNHDKNLMEGSIMKEPIYLTGSSVGSTWSSVRSFSHASQIIQQRNENNKSPNNNLGRG
jgi:hypothetical protein